MAKILVTFENVELGELFEMTSGEICIKVGAAYACELQYEYESTAPSMYTLSLSSGAYVYRDPKIVKRSEMKTGCKYSDSEGYEYILTDEDKLVQLNRESAGYVTNIFDHGDLYEVFPECCLVED